ncbi:nucleotidyltransferase family protein [Filomicrobium insigne]|uniref:nucleotidyltransferase family protein n=1 Tax=Filomicrobium insigne TaxID=418854 RepID=UPI000AD79CE3|nr:nucleotidyltransferase family protein [Filomicrobium insigne]
MKIGCVIPAAGFSRRFGTADKLTAELDGTALVRKVCEAVVASRVAVCLVVTQPAAVNVVTALLGLPVSIVENPKAALGMGTSIAAGVAALDTSVSGAFVLPADMPGMTSEFLDQLIACFASEGGRKIIVPVTPSGEQRNPVLWPAAHFEALKALGSEGGKKLLDELREQVVQVPQSDASLFADVDTPEDFVRLLGGRVH